MPVDKKAKNRAWREKNLDAQRAREREVKRQPEARARILAQRKVKRRADAVYRAREVGAVRRQNLKKFGLTVGQFEQMRQAQGSVCAICFRTNNRRSKLAGQTFELAVDHDHDTGAIRGLLCSRCNIALGLFDDSPEMLWRAIRYLREHAKPWVQAGKS